MSEGLVKKEEKQRSANCEMAKLGTPWKRGLLGPAFTHRARIDVRSVVRRWFKQNAQLSRLPYKSEVTFVNSNIAT